MPTDQRVYDPVQAELAIERLHSVFQSVERINLRQFRPNLDMGRVAIFVLAVAQYASRPKVRKLFEKLQSIEVFELRHLDMLPDLAWSAWYAKVRYNQLMASKVTGIVPADLAQRISDRKQRMLRVAEYHLLDHPTASLVVQAIRKGSGHVDEASDLTSLVGLYETHREAFAADKKWYREDDAREAEKEAAMLLRLLGGGLDDEVKQALDLMKRVYICVQSSYDEVRAAACYGFRSDPEALKHFPLLHAAVRRPRSPRRPGKEVPVVPLVQGGEPSEALGK